MLVAAAVARRIGLRGMFVGSALIYAAATGVVDRARDARCCSSRRGPSAASAFAGVIVAVVLTIAPLLPAELQATGQSLYPDRRVRGRRRSSPTSSAACCTTDRARRGVRPGRVARGRSRRALGWFVFPRERAASTRPPARRPSPARRPCRRAAARRRAAGRSRAGRAGRPAARSGSVPRLTIVSSAARPIEAQHRLRRRQPRHARPAEPEVLAPEPQARSGTARGTSPGRRSAPSTVRSRQPAGWGSHGIEPGGPNPNGGAVPGPRQRHAAAVAAADRVPGPQPGRVLEQRPPAGPRPPRGRAPRPGTGTRSRAARASAAGGTGPRRPSSRSVGSTRSERRRPTARARPPTRPSRVTCRAWSWFESTQVAGAPTGPRTSRLSSIARRSAVASQPAWRNRKSNAVWSSSGRT